jgi:predicted phage-related endonuclease
MTEKMIENRIRKLQAIEEQQKELEAQAEAIRAELKTDLEAKGQDELTTKNGFIVRWKEIISNRLDGKALKAALPEIYAQYTRQSASRRFTIA